MTLYFEPWQLVAVCLLTIVGAAVVAVVLVGLLGAWLFRDRGSVPVARTVAEPKPQSVKGAAPGSGPVPAMPPAPKSSVRLHAVHDRDACDACAGRDRGSF